MPNLIKSPTVVPAVGSKPKRIEEYLGRVNTGDESCSIARMVSPQGWIEPGQRPEFRETTVVLRGVLHVETDGDTIEVHPGQALVTEAGEWVRYSTPGEEVRNMSRFVCRPSHRILCTVITNRRRRVTSSTRYRNV